LPCYARALAAQIANKLGALHQRCTNIQDSGWEMPIFNSSAIKRAEYDTPTMRLQIWFPEGHSYFYCRVPLPIWQGLLSATSKGTYFNQRIRDFYKC
jgi:hypothetical protein